MASPFKNHIAADASIWINLLDMSRNTGHLFPVLHELYSQHRPESGFAIEPPPGKIYDHGHMRQVIDITFASKTCPGKRPGTDIAHYLPETSACNFSASKYFFNPDIPAALTEY